MKPTFVSLCGVDESIPAKEVVQLASHPLVEVGILVHPEKTLYDEYNPRYPGWRWIEEVIYHAQFGKPKLSLHLCGGFASDLVAGEFSFLKFWKTWLASFYRIQINAGQAGVELYADNLRRMLYALEPCRLHKFVWQTNEHSESVLAGLLEEELSFAPLFDASRGHGVQPDQWPKPVAPLNGYAGGISLDNLDSVMLTLRGLDQVNESVEPFEPPTDGYSVETDDPAEYEPEPSPVAVLDPPAEREFWICLESSLRDEKDRFSLETANEAVKAFEFLCRVE